MSIEEILYSLDEETRRFKESAAISSEAAIRSAYEWKAQTFRAAAQLLREQHREVQS